MAKRFAWAMPLVLVAASVEAGVVLPSAVVNASASFDIDADDDMLDRSDIDDDSAAAGSVAAQVADPLEGKANAFASATFGVLRASAEIDPDLAYTPRFFAVGEASFEDQLTIEGSNEGPASATFRLHVDGSIQQPFVVTEVIGYASGSVSFSASSSTDSDDFFDGYGIFDPEDPLTLPVDAILEISVSFDVGDTINLLAILSAAGSAAGLNVDPEVATFAADFASTATLLPIVLSGVNDPVISAASGTIYAIAGVPEASSVAFLTSAALAAMVVRRVRR